LPLLPAAAIDGWLAGHFQLILMLSIASWIAADSQMFSLPH